MPKKKVTSKRCGYISFMEYFATGEGFTYEINFCYADSPEEARELHLDRFIGKEDESARQYFGVGVDVVKSNSKKAKELFKAFFNDSDKMLEHLNKAGLEMHFKLYYNYS